MYTWEQFAAAAPELAKLGRERFDRTGLVLLGTLRRDGTPRITPIEPHFFEGDLYVGGMWQSKKNLDLLRDPRCLVHSIVSNKNGTDGEFKLRGRAVAKVLADGTWVDPAFRERYNRAVEATFGFLPPEPYHVFAVDIEDATFIRYPEGPDKMLRWTRRDV